MSDLMAHLTGGVLSIVVLGRVGCKGWSTTMTIVRVVSSATTLSSTLRESSTTLVSCEGTEICKWLKRRKNRSVSVRSSVFMDEELVKFMRGDEFNSGSNRGDK